MMHRDSPRRLHEAARGAAYPSVAMRPTADRVRRAFPFLLVLAALMTTSHPADAQNRRVFISADLEGVAGAVTGEQLSPTGFEYQRFREFMTAEVLAAMEGARQAGATSFLVADSHGNMQNLLIERFPDDVEIIRASPRPLGMMQGIDESFDAVIFIGYHSAATNPAGVRAHTFSSANLAAVHLNGQPVSEGAFNAALAGHFGVPVVLVTGDDAAVEEMRDLLGDVEGAVVKTAIGFHSARTMTPAAAQREIRDASRRALARLPDFTPHRLEGSVTVEVMFKNYRPAEILSLLPVVERSGARSIRYTGSDMVEIAHFMQVLLSYEAGLTP
jgi:D-amino peptidase